MKEAMRDFYGNNPRYYELIEKCEGEGFHYDFLLEKLIARCAVAGIMPRVLDVAVGTGHYLERSGRFGAKGFGIDLSLHACRMARSKSEKAAVCRSDAEALPFRDGVFDLVLCLQMLEHVPGPEHVVREITRVLKPGGWLFLSAPNMLGSSPFSRFLRAVRFRFSKETRDLQALPGDILSRWEHAATTRDVADLDACNRTTVFQALNLLRGNGLEVEYSDTSRHPKKYGSVGYLLARVRQKIPILKYAGVNFKIIARKRVPTDV